MRKLPMTALKHALPLLLAYLATCLAPRPAPAQVVKVQARQIVIAGQPVAEVQIAGGDAAAATAATAPTAPQAGPAVVTIYDERLTLKPTAVHDDKVTVPTEPPREIPLDEIDSIDLGNVPAFQVEWVGQDNRDVVQVGAANVGNEIQDIHLRLTGLAVARQVKQIVVSGAQASHGVWRLDPAMSTSWRIAIERFPESSTAEMFFEPPSSDCLERDYTVTVTYDDGSTVTASVHATTSTSDRLAITAGQGPATAGDAAPAVVVHGRGGLLLRGHLVELTDKDLKLRTSWGAETVLPLVRVDGIWFGASTQAEALARFDSLRSDPAAEDVVMALGRDQAVAELRGTAAGFAAGRLTFEYQGESRTISAARLVGLALAAHPPAPESRDPFQIFQLTSGDRLAGRWQSMTDQELAVDADWGGTLSLPQNLVSSIKCRNGKLSYVSDLDPGAVEQVAFLGRPMPFRRDQSLVGGPLKIKGKEYPKGVAVHAKSALTYAIDGQFQQFRAVVGFDDTAAAAGSVSCRILGDGQELYSNPTLTAAGEPASIDIAVAGVKELTLVVDFGAYEDVGDRVIWADAKLLREVRQ